MDTQTTFQETLARKAWINKLIGEDKFKREEIATAASVSPRTVSRWRREGSERAPDDGQVLAIAANLGVDLPPGLGVAPPNGNGLTVAHRHVGYELRDERGDIVARVSILMEVGKTRRGTIDYLGD